MTNSSNSTSSSPPRIYDVAPDERVSETVVRAVARASGSKPVAGSQRAAETPVLPPLYDAVDPDRLDGLVTHADPSDRDLAVSFSYYGFDVTVRADDAVAVELRPTD